MKPIADKNIEPQQNIRREIHPTSQALVRACAEKLVGAAQESIAARGVFSLALSGGSTPRALYELLAGDEWREKLEWSKIHIFFGDERAVSPNDERANFRMARETLLDKISIPQANIHRMEGEREDLVEAARDYEIQLQQFAPLDLVLLGMGDDGHTASLFPQSPALQETEKLCVATPVASLEPHVRRLTLTFPVINSARCVWILVTGKSKAVRLKEVLESAGDTASTPIRGVAPHGELLWLLDEEATSQL